MIEKVDSIILGLRKDLEIYVQKENVNSFIVDKNNSRILQLTQVRNFLAQLIDNVDFHVMLNILNQMADLERQDPELNGHIITLLKQDGTKLSSITQRYF